MRKQGLHRRGGAALLALLLAMACFTVSVLAREDIDLDSSSSISVYFGSGSRGFSGVDFSLYRVADVSESGEYTLTGDFRRYDVSLDGLDSSGWRALAQTLDAYAARDGLDPLQEGETGSGGRAYFTGLRPGLYLVSGERYISGGAVYTPEAMLVSVPGEADGGGWDYSVEVTCKYDRDEITEEYTSVSVKKVWDDGGDKSARPGYIYVQLLENGTELIFEFVGLDYRCNARLPVYHRMLLEIVDYGIRKGFRTIDFGQTADDTKLKLGSGYTYLYAALHHSNPLVNALCRKFAPFLEYKPLETRFRVFKEEP